MDVIYTLDEVSFIQNLVFYIEKAYCTPVKFIFIQDYGIFERGDKTNHGLPELNSSSIGMAKVLFFKNRPPLRQSVSLIFLAQMVENCRSFTSSPIVSKSVTYFLLKQVLLQYFLPKESLSKVLFFNFQEVAASLLSIITFPAFAIENKKLLSQTRDLIVSKLEVNLFQNIQFYNYIKNLI